MLKKFILLLCVAFTVVCYAYPCLILPIGSYKGEIKAGDITTEVSYKFGFNGKVEIATGENKDTKYYKLNGNSVIISDDDKFDDDDTEIKLKSMYEFNALTEMTNSVGRIVAICVGAVAVVMILLPNKKK